jgi:quercetin dioxygenase-like cupin family protein
MTGAGVVQFREIAQQDHARAIREASMAKSRRPARKKARKKVQPRRRPVRLKANARRAVKAKTRAKANPKARKSQRFTVSHHREEDFDQGLRAYSAYRDLGLAPATDGLVQAHVIRMTKPFSADEVAIPHYHDVDFQMVYVLKGWFQSEFEGEGVHTFYAGSCWIQPPGIKHTVRGYSDDCELLEIVLPADFETVTLEG